MSNKTLIIIIIIILIGCAGGVLAYRSYQDRNVVGQSPDTYSDQKTQTSSSTNTSANLDTQTSTSTNQSNNKQTMEECKRDFNQDTLKNAKVDIKGRQVSMTVKDFGTINLEFYDKDAPKAVENFLRLVNSGYYNCLTFHRVAKGFVIQGGDPSGNGTGGESAFGVPFADELDSNTPSAKAGYVKGVLAMANSGPNTNGSQFFIMLADNQLPHLYTIFGKVTSGLDVVDKIGQVPIIPQMGPTDGAPVTPVVMESVKIVK